MTKTKEFSVLFRPYVDLLKKLNALKGYKDYNADRGLKRKFVEEKLIPLLNQADRIDKDPKTRTVMILSGRSGLPKSLVALRKSLNNLWKFRPRSNKLSESALRDPKAIEAMKFLKECAEQPFKSVSFHKARTHLNNLDVKIPERTKKNILVAMAKAMEFKFPKDYFNGL